MEKHAIKVTKNLIYAMQHRLDGETLQEIGDALGVTRARVDQMLKPFHFAETHRLACIYPNIRRYIEVNRITVSEFMLRCGFAPTNATKILTGRNLSVKTIARILAATGMTFDEAFATEATEADDAEQDH